MGISTHKHYRRWVHIRERCYNTEHSSYGDYGARGIKMSDEFMNSSALFCAYLDSLPGWAPGMTLDRIDNDRGYERGNMRWASRSTQNRNRRSYGKGYYWHKRKEKWEVQWGDGNGKIKYYGNYATEEEAIERARETCPGKYRY